MDQRNVPAIAYRLWNPRAGAIWGFFILPLGAGLHALNWREIGEPYRARSNLIWMWGVIALVVLLSVVGIMLPQNRLIDALARGTGLMLWCGWYWTQGRVQVDYAKSLGDGGYTKRGWAKPLLVTLGAIALYFVVLFIVAYAHEYFTLARAPDTQDTVELAAWAKSDIESEWHKKPKLADATIQSLVLTRKADGSYTGVLDATVLGAPVRDDFELVIEKDRTYSWKVTKRAKPDQGAPASK